MVQTGSFVAPAPGKASDQIRRLARYIAHVLFFWKPFRLLVVSGTRTAQSRSAKLGSRPHRIPGSPQFSGSSSWRALGVFPKHITKPRRPGILSRPGTGRPEPLAQKAACPRFQPTPRRLRMTAFCALRVRCIVLAPAPISEGQRRKRRMGL